jgi:hypothetical protein
MNSTAEHLIVETWFCAFASGTCPGSLESDVKWANKCPTEILDDMIALMEDNPEDYDEDWYPLIATRGIRNQLNWNLIGLLAQERLVDDIIKQMFNIEW